MRNPPTCRPFAPASGRTLADIAEWLVNEFGYPLDGMDGTRPVPVPVPDVLRWHIARAWARIDPEPGATARDWYRICQQEGGW